MQPKFLDAQRQEVGAKFSLIWKVGRDIDQHIRWGVAPLGKWVRREVPHSRSSSSSSLVSTRWYVSNISIILMLHACLYTICFEFCYTSWRFYAFSRTNLLTRCHSASSLFFAIFVFQKSYTGNILGIGRNKKPNLLFLPKLREDRRWDGGGPGARLTTGGARTSPWPRRPMVRPAGPTSDDALSPIKSPRWEKPKGRISFHETYCKLPPSSSRDREDQGALPGTLPERGIHAGGLLHHHGRLRSDVWVVYIGLWVHSSS
jgi:hypothetical protein